MIYVMLMKYHCDYSDLCVDQRSVTGQICDADIIFQ